MDHENLPYTKCFVPEAGGGYSCYVKELRGCMSQGGTLIEAYYNLNDAMRNWIEATRGIGQEIPAPDGNFWPTNHA